jgi:glycosyltransferase involved in cell wall biosynthesis
MQRARPALPQPPAALSPRIALFIATLRGSGAERSTVNLANALADRGHPVDLVLGIGGGPFLKLVKPDVRVVHLGARSALGALALAPRRPRDFAALAPMLASLDAPKTLGAIPRLASYLRRERPRALLSALDHGNIAAVIARDIADVPTRIVISQRNHFSADIDNAKRARVSRLGPLIGRFYPRADAIAAVSRGVADDLADELGLARERVVAVYNAVAGPELTAQAEAPLDHPWFAKGLPPVILGVGKLKAQKDFPTLLRAFAELRRTRPVRLLILGEGPERSALEAMARDLGVAGDVALPGFAENPFAYMARADVFALSSAFEGLPGVLIQAIACGCPVVSTDCPSGPDEILEGGRHGRLVPVGDASALARAIAATLDAPPDRDALKRRGAFFSADRAVEGYLDLLLDRPAAGEG